MRTFRGTATVQLNNSVNDVAYLSGARDFNPLEILAGNEYQSMAHCFEMFRIRRARVYLQPAFASYSPTSSLTLNSAASTTVWTVSDYTSVEGVVGNNDIKNYQNARFHTLSLNSIKKIVDTQVRFFRKNSQSMTAGVMPPNYWADTTYATDGTFSNFQYLIEVPGFDNISTAYRPKYRFIYELDIEFKQPATNVTPSSFAINIVLGKILKLGDYPTITPPSPGGFTDYECVGYKSQDVAGTQTLTFRFSNATATPATLTLTADELRTAIEQRSYAGQVAQWNGPMIPIGI